MNSLLCRSFVALLLGSIASFGYLLAASAAPKEATIQGKVVIETGKPARIESSDKSILLTSDRKSIVETLKDVRLSGKQMKLLGEFRDDGSFEIHDFYILRNDSLYRLIYYCDT